MQVPGTKNDKKSSKRKNFGLDGLLAKPRSTSVLGPNTFWSNLSKNPPRVGQIF